jgi:CHAT domain-containing protein
MLAPLWLTATGLGLCFTPPAQDASVSAAQPSSPVRQATLAQRPSLSEDLGVLLKEAAQYRQKGWRRLEAFSLSWIGKQLTQRNQPSLAIVFYKQALDRLESVRRDLRQVEALAGEPSSSGSLQRPLVQTFSNLVYRPLADLLLQEDRVWEALQVLDLLKVEELNDYLQNVRGSSKAESLAKLPPESQIAAKFGDLQQRAIALGQELTALRQIPDRDRTPAQQQRLAALVNVEQELNRQFNDFIGSPEIAEQLEQLNRTARRQNINLEDLNGLRENLRQLDRAVLLYPLILDDRLELILTTPDAPPLRRTVPVSRMELNRAIALFRSALTSPGSDTKTPAQTLYKWLIQPFAAELQATNTQTLIYAPDAQLRYIPLAALHDGQQWLVQRFRINNITARSLTDLVAQPPLQFRILAGAFVQGSYQVQIGNRNLVFQGLPFAGKEVDTLETTIPGTTKLIDRDFSRSMVIPRMNDYSIIHFATHAAFMPGQPEDSFILFGNGERATLRDIENWSLPRVALIVLSACETGIGEQLGTGEEILGLGYQFQRAGVQAAIASLWSVNDGGTQVLMNAFYSALQKGMTKAEALRQAQIVLITGDASAIEGDRGGLGVVANPTASRSRYPLGDPYYWASFILIGNGL